MPHAALIRRRVLLAAPVALLPSAAFAQAGTPVGLWRQVDDETGQARALIRIFESEGKLYGRVERVLVAEYAARTCADCPGDMKGKPMLGLVFLRGFESGGSWRPGRNGSIVDPATGRTYKGTLRVADGGRKLEVRGYLGISLLGRTQTWLREG